MGRVLCVSNGLPGGLYSSLELARRLARVGHSVCFASVSSVEHAVRAHGFEFVCVETGGYEGFLEMDSTRGLIQRWLTVRRRRAQAVQAMRLEPFMERVRAFEPDLVLVDQEMHEEIIALSALRVPLALFNTFASVWRNPGVPPPHRLARPGAGWTGTRIGMWSLWLELRGRKWLRRVWQRGRRVGCDRVSVLRALAHDSGFRFGEEVDFSHWLIPFAYRRLPVLSLHALEFEFAHEPLKHVRYVGPMMAERRIDAQVPDAVRAELETLAERRRTSRGRRKVIYGAFGSFFSTGVGFVQRLVEAVATETDWDLVVSAANRPLGSQLRDVPPNVHVFPWLPQIEVLKHADVVVTHGGINTIDEAVLCGVPMLVYCGFETDMAGNTARVVHHGLGIAGDRGRDTVETIRAHIRRVLRERRFRDQVHRFRTRYAAYADDQVAERVVAALLAGERSA